MEMGVAATDKSRIHANCRNFLCILDFLSALDLGDFFAWAISFRAIPNTDARPWAAVVFRTRKKISILLRSE